jgi:hypothetical protein
MRDNLEKRFMRSGPDENGGKGWKWEVLDNVGNGVANFAQEGSGIIKRGRWVMEPVMSSW